MSEGCIVLSLNVEISQNKLMITCIGYTYKEK